MKQAANHNSRPRSLSVKLGLLLLLLFLGIITAASVGSSRLSFLQSFQILFKKLPWINSSIPAGSLPASFDTIVWGIRLPRIFLSVLCGSALAVVGAVYQAVFRNPLADPHILGVSSGAAFGASLAIVFGLSLPGFPLGPIGGAAFVTSLAAVLLVYNTAGERGGGRAASSMLLVGIAVSTLLSALISLLMLFHHEQVAKIYFWTLGSFNGASWEKVLFLALFVLPLEIWLMTYGRELNVLMSGEEEAMGLGLDTARLRRFLVILTTLLVAASVSVSGIIGFVGLIVPHCVRLLKENDQRRLLPLAALSGSLFMLFCDTIARTILAPTEVPVGIITSLFGVPYFLALLLWKRQKGEL